MKKIHIAVIGLAITAITASIIYIIASSNSALKADSLSVDPNSRLLVANCPVLNEPLDTITNPLDALKQHNTKADGEDNDTSTKSLVLIQKSPLFQKLLTQSLSENNCGAGALQTLSIIYEYSAREEKKKEVHEKLITYAEKNIPQALFALCEGGDTHEEKIKYCLSILKDNTNTYPMELKKLAGDHYTYNSYTLQARPSKEQIETLADVCEISNSQVCYTALVYATEDFQIPNEAEPAIVYLEKILKYVEHNHLNEQSFPALNKVYLSSLPSLYAQANQDEKLIKFCSDRTIDEEYKSNCDLAMTAQGEDRLKKAENDKAFHLFEKVSLEIDANKKSNNNDERAEAKANLGMMYFKGLGTEQDLNLAKYWLKESIRTAPRKTKAFALGILSYIYYRENDKVGAFRARKQAAELGSPHSQALLAMDYFYGTGTIQDYKEAYAWASVAISTGATISIGTDDPAHKDIVKATKDMARIQLINENTLNEADALAKEYYNTYAYGAVVN